MRQGSGANMGGPCLVDGSALHELDNFLPCRFELWGCEWPTAEHAFQAAKFPGNCIYQEQIRVAATGGDAWALAQDARGAASLRPDWERVKVKVMYEVNRAKFIQNPELQTVLVQSNGPIIAFGFPFWAKWNAILLERLREELRPPAARNAERLAQTIMAMDEYAACCVRSSRPQEHGGSGRACAEAGGIPFPPQLCHLMKDVPVRPRMVQPESPSEFPGAAPVETMHIDALTAAKPRDFPSHTVPALLAAKRQAARQGSGGYIYEL